MAKKRVITSALILTAAGIITSVIGFIYRIYLSNTIGAEGMGLYQLIMPVYMLGWSVSASGFTTAVSKLTAQEKAKGRSGSADRILRLSAAITLTLGIITAALICFFAEIIAISFLKEPRAALPLRILAAALPFMSGGSCLRWYFYGLRETLVPAINQVLEQLFKMAALFLIIGFFAPHGIVYACAAAALGVVAQEIFSLGFLLVTFKRTRKRERLGSSHHISVPAALGLILAAALPLTANHVADSFLLTLESALIPQRLQTGGLSAGEAMRVFGRVTGMAMPLIFFPTAFLTSLSISLVPSVSEATAEGNSARVVNTSARSMLSASLIGFCAAGVLVTFAREFGTVVYNQDIAAMLIPLGALCPLLYTRIVLSGILNGMGFQALIFRNSILSSVVKIGFIYFLTPALGINAFILGWAVSLAAVCFLEIRKLRRCSGLQLELNRWLICPAISAVAAGTLARLASNRLAFIESDSAVGLAASAALFVTLYFTFVTATGSLAVSDIKYGFAPIFKRGRLFF